MPKQASPSLKNLLSEAFKSALPPPRQTVAEFAEQECVLSAENAAATGKWRNIPYQVEMQNVLTDPKIRIACFMTSTQVGKTSVIKNMIAWICARSAGGTTFMLPSESVAKDFSKVQLMPLFRDTPILSEKVAGARKDGNTHLFKSWSQGYVRLVGSLRATKLSSFPSARLFVDELDRCSRVAINDAGISEGDPIQLFLERCKNWPDRFALFTSTPTIEGASAIEHWWLKSDQRLPHIPCPHCGYFQFLEWKNFEWQGKDDPLIEPAVSTICYRCHACQKTFTDKTRLKWLAQLKWVKQNPSSEIAGFHINAFYSPWSNWSDLLQKRLDAGKSHLKLMVWTNTTLGLPYSLDAVKPPDWARLANREKGYQRYTVPAKVRILLAACDVQFDRLEISVVGFYKKRAYVITHEVFPGNTGDADDQCWADLEEFLRREWAADNGYKLRIYRCAIDHGFNTNQVAEFVRKRKIMVPVNGIDNWEQDILPSRPMLIKRNGKVFSTGKRRWPVGVSAIKTDLYSRLKLSINESCDVPSEYISFPDGLGQEYYKQLTGEVCKIEEDKRGREKMIWEKHYDAVEALDCFVYILALYKICGLHLWPDEKWES